MAGIPRHIFVSSGPFYFGGHGGEDSVNVAAGFETESCAAIIKQVEFDVAAAADQLFLAVGWCPGIGVVAAHDHGVDAGEGATNVLSEG
jgi:hypothetical protein